MIGSTISRYKIVDKLGEGGMGAVYQAEDTDLGRPVALKFLAPHLLNDPEAKQRFLREAKAAAAITHPNICHVYEVGEADGKTFLAMAYLEGESLEDRIAKGPLPLRDALDIGRQIAEGLEAAHEKGIVHRDIKPANIMVDAKGRATILDFGLARLTEASKLTRPDQTVGTAAYMSPEQMQGGEVDQRTDIWALGCVLYEMVAGVRPFPGQYDQALAYEIVNQDPEPLTGVRAGVPMELEFIVGKCLAKDRDERYRRTEDVALDLANLRKKLSSGRSTLAKSSTGSVILPPGTGQSFSMSAPRVADRPRGRERLAWIVAAVALAGAAITAYLHLGEPAPRRETMRFEITAPEGVRISSPSVEISPDGRHLAFVEAGGDRRLWLRSIDSLEAHALPDAQGAEYPFWSPDSRYVAFFADRKLKKVDITGGPAQTICDAPNGRGGSWAHDPDDESGVILFAPEKHGGLWLVSAAGGDPVEVTKADDAWTNSHRFPHFLPDARRFLYVGGQIRQRRIYVGSLDAKTQEGSDLSILEPLLPDDSPARYAPPQPGRMNGYVVFARETTLMAQELDLERLQLVGQPHPVGRGVLASAMGGSSSDFSVSQGILAYQVDAGAAVSGPSQITWFDREGRQLSTVGEPGHHLGISLSPDERRAAIGRFDATGGDIWINDLGRAVASRFTFQPGPEMAHVWSPDGESLVFSWGAGEGPGTDLFTKSTLGAGEVTLLLDTPNNKWPRDWSRDAGVLLFTEQGAETGSDLWTFPMAGTNEPQPYLTTEFNETDGRFSPNGKWVAYVSDESNQKEVYVQPYPADGRKWRVSTEGGEQPRWGPAGSELFFVSPEDRVMTVQTEAGEAFDLGAPALLFEAPIGRSRSTYSRFEVSNDGQRFLIKAETRGVGKPPVTVVVNWQTELEQ